MCEGVIKRLNQMEEKLDSLYAKDAQLESEEEQLIESLKDKLKERFELEVQFKQLDAEIIHLRKDLLEKALSVKNLTGSMFELTTQDQLIEALRKGNIQLFNQLLEVEQ